MTIADGGVRLTQMSKTAGCTAKIGPRTLVGILESLPKFQDENLLVGTETSDNGAIYKVSDEAALIQILDFFAPVVDDPYTSGQVATANTLSDIYAMGGEPKVALNIVAWPSCVNPKFLGEILRDGADKVMRAGAVPTGGRSVQDDKPKYGLSVTGPMRSDQVLKGCGVMSGNVLILTKPLGTGVVSTAVKTEMASPETQQGVIRVMTTLNKKTKQIIEKYEIHSCTDVTSFDLTRHSIEMAEGSGVTFDIEVGQLPIQQAAIEYTQMELISTGAYRNRNLTEEKIEMGNVEEHPLDIFFSPQTSGGLLVSAVPEVVERIIKEMERSGTMAVFGIIGTVTEEQERYMRLWQ